MLEPLLVGKLNLVLFLKYLYVHPFPYIPKFNRSFFALPIFFHFGDQHGVNIMISCLCFVSKLKIKVHFESPFSVIA